MTKHLVYLRQLCALLDEIILTQTPAIEACAGAFADALERGGDIFLFGTGHSSLLAEELFYRAGGLVKLRPILDGALMLHESASKSTEAERAPGCAEKLMQRYGVKKDDVIVIISNSGRNAVCVDMALLAKNMGATVIALTNLRHSRVSASRHPCGKRLFELADIVLDNCGCVGDASVYFDELGLCAAPTSTSAGAAILNAAVAGCIELLLGRGVTPEVFASSNVDGGDGINAAYLQKYRDQIISL